MAPRSQRPVLFPISPSAIPAFSSSFRVHDSLSFAYSTTTNARNSEAEYYAAYQHTLSDLTNFPCDSSLSVQPQSDLWLSSAALEKAVLAAVAAGDGPDGYSSAEEEQAQAANKGSAPLGVRKSTRERHPPKRTMDEFLLSADARLKLAQSERSKVPQLSRAAVKRVVAQYKQDRKDAQASVSRNNPPPAADADAGEFLLEDIAEVADQSFETLPDAHAEESFPDFAVCHVTTSLYDEPDNEASKFPWKCRQGRRVEHQCFPMLVENKRNPSRTLRPGEEFDVDLSELLWQGLGDLIGYAAVYFERDEYAQSVILLAGAGLHWRWLEVSAAEVPPLVLLQSQQVQGIPVPIHVKWNARPCFVLGTEESDQELIRLRKEALVPLLQSHERYPMTMARNSKKEKKEKGDKGKNREP